jgi:adenosylmethionine-8-amino-7-oxononanoate aminotransferase
MVLIQPGNNMSTNEKLLYFMFDRALPVVERAQGYYYHDVEGRQYLDATSGAYNCVLGHTMPERIAHVLREQTQRFSYASMAYFHNDAANRLADRLLTLMPDFAAACFFQSGADAVEAALRCALQVARTRSGPSRTKIIGRRGAYHGLTLGGLALGAHDSIRSQDVPNFLHIEAQDCFKCPYGLSYPGCDTRCASALEELIEREGPETIAAFVGVPSTNGGPLPDEYWPKIRAICDRHGILLVSDDVLEGMWRIGPAVALNRWGVVPDIVATGKVLGSGFMPIFATLVTDTVRNTLTQSGKFWGGHTYMGHVLSCEVAHAVLDEIEERELSSKGVERVTRLLHEALARSSQRVPGARMSTLGAMGRLCIPCGTPADARALFLLAHSLLREVGLIAWIDEIVHDYIEIGFAPPFIADEPFFQELESRLNRFLDALQAKLQTATLDNASLVKTSGD